MELQPRSARLAQTRSRRLTHRVGRALMMVGAALGGAIVLIAIVLGILFFSGETQEFIYMNF
ncbi:hypothetical protein QJQ58_19420 [Paenibacillus dendritiformis]|uniref:Uncharacterized protein n=1 Tax=Paenibacillus dendritiformis C454 TaxID=1131935 RepID=H3SNB9_9BACL|nr:hypothetical protein [Paenibacillus dendritiformis]EHQ59430.1 hypothetical protein PDENDC454_25346 [Paenibacillus dendritiformis C454]PZM63786.1 hypothetical protein DOE73_20350 [Paenibacillus dendritiformis]TDL53005.1 hypothetical protein E2R60_17535 [Paenibacillus dendritiformis]WGU92724.1 hypothetical protein QJQ58_19420 [Paenibacillus dendritiformis]CAH8768496.1 hypothetical protein H7S4_001191 [Paenibacillus dendritiformis]